MASDEPGPGQQYALKAGKHIATLRRARSTITIEVRWCLPHEGVEGNQKVDKRAKIAVEEPDSREVEWMNYPEQVEALTMPLPRFFANLKREISEKTWVAARRWAGVGPSGKNTKCQKSISQTARQLEAPIGSPQCSTR